MTLNTLREILEDNTTKRGRNFDYFIQTLIFISLISFSIETLPDNSEYLSNILRYVEFICVTVFSLEYILRVIVSEKPFRYIFSFYGLVDLLSVIPFYLKIAIDLRVLRVFRVFRLFRALKLIRYNRALNRFHLAAKIVKEEMILFLILTIILIYISASGIYFFENEAQPEVFKSVFHSLWWSVATLTTVGYGDVYPITVGGRIFTFFILLIGLGIVTIPAGLVATALGKARNMQKDENKSG
ncbi:voltage-gated potassium channel [Tenacibaculum sp. MAR_2009_124]|uniref:ion transporter n=1 Tax=Tenacibaculum sp. MAR_2009_124 TaxID=1250059 RepID=UPI0008969C98|nr:ion transporter [Tenacibaculum sp. MAR_2009_124]SEC46467.1 voltage-gated potassium channel [Tenacibaculum sp. MAR_2009_124]